MEQRKQGCMLVEERGRTKCFLGANSTKVPSSPSSLSSPFGRDELNALLMSSEQFLLMSGEPSFLYIEISLLLHLSGGPSYCLIALYITSYLLLPT